jgi:hypothetical protein
MKHEAEISRFELGRGALRGSGMKYGTRVRCSCGDWQSRTNSYPPSRGGKIWGATAHRDNHLPYVTPERDLQIAEIKLQDAVQRLTEAVERGFPPSVRAEGTRVQRAAEELAQEMQQRTEREVTR